MFRPMKFYHVHIFDTNGNKRAKRSASRWIAVGDGILNGILEQVDMRLDVANIQPGTRSFCSSGSLQATVSLINMNGYELASSGYLVHKSVRSNKMDLLPKGWMEFFSPSIEGARRIVKRELGSHCFLPYVTGGGIAFSSAHANECAVYPVKIIR